MRSRLLLVAAAALLLLAVIAASAGAARGARGCSAAGLVVWAGEEPGGGAAGSFYYRIELTNLSGRPCVVSGYPTVRAVDLRGRRLGAPAVHEGGRRARAVRLRPGQSAAATLRIVDALNFPARSCGLTTAAGLRVGVPGGTGAKIAPLAFETCARPSVENLAVGPVTHRD